MSDASILTSTDRMYVRNTLTVFAAIVLVALLGFTTVVLVGRSNAQVTKKRYEVCATLQVPQDRINCIHGPRTNYIDEYPAQAKP